MTQQTKATVIPAIAALAGAVAGSLLGVILSGYAESKRLEALHRSVAIDAFIEAAWANSSEQESIETYQKLVNKLTVYAPEQLLCALAEYHETDCAAKGDPTPECRELWSNVVAEMREFTGAKQIENEVIVGVIWGRTPTSPP